MPRSYRSVHRERAAAATREVILDAAEALFLEHGYAATTVAAIAERADVALTTIYGSVGNKAGIVLALIERGAGDPAIRSTTDEVRASDTASGAIEALVKGVRESIEDLLPVITVMYETALTDRSIASAVEAAEASYRRNMESLVDRLEEGGWLRSDVSHTDAVDIVWFFLGTPAWRTMHQLGWSWKKAAAWVTHELHHALVAVPAAS